MSTCRLHSANADPSAYTSMVCESFDRAGVEKSSSEEFEINRPRMKDASIILVSGLDLMRGACSSCSMLEEDANLNDLERDALISLRDNASHFIFQSCEIVAGR